MFSVHFTEIAISTSVAACSCTSNYCRTNRQLTAADSGQRCFSCCPLLLAADRTWQSCYTYWAAAPSHPSYQWFRKKSIRTQSELLAHYVQVGYEATLSGCCCSYFLTDDIYSAYFCHLGCPSLRLSSTFWFNSTVVRPITYSARRHCDSSCLLIAAARSLTFWGQISPNRLKIGAWFQRTTNRQWCMLNRMVTWSMMSRDLERTSSKFHCPLPGIRTKTMATINVRPSGHWLKRLHAPLEHNLFKVVRSWLQVIKNKTNKLPRFIDHVIV